jgi:hypothetical protein
MNVAWTRFGPEAEAALAAAVAHAQVTDALAPVHVATPNRYAALSARRALAARPRGLANVRCEPLARLADLFATPELIAQGERPLGPARWAQAIRDALPGSAPSIATVRAYTRAFADLRRVDERALAAIAEADVHAAQTVARFHNARHAVPNTFDDETVMQVAAHRISRDPVARAALGTVILWLPHRTSPAELTFLRALQACGQLVAVFATTGEPEVDAPIIAIATALGIPTPNQHGTDPGVPPANVQLRRAPDPEEEVRAALRTVLARAERGRPLHEHAILVRDLEPYGRIVHEQAAAAGIPIAGPDSRRLLDTVVGRFVHGLVSFDLAALHRDEYIAWLASAPIIDPATGDRVRALRWDTLTRNAGLIADATTFGPALDAWISQRERELGDVRTDDAFERKRRAILRDITDARELTAFTHQFVTSLSEHAARSWSEWATWSRDRVGSYLGSDARRRDWPEAELIAAGRIDRALDALAALEGPVVERGAFADALALELDAPCDAIGRFGTGVFVGRVSDALGTSFAHVQILGVNDGAFPGARRCDALLPEAARAAGGLPTRAERRAQDRLAFLGATAAGIETICSFSVADPRRQRPALPSRWLVLWATAWSGELIGADELRVMPDTQWMSTIPSFAAGLHATPTLHRQDAQLAALDRVNRMSTPVGSDELERTLASARARRTGGLSAYQGGVGPHPGLREAKSVSPTALETWARCPRAFFFAKVLGLAEVQRPEALDSIRPDERGTLVHKVLERFINEARPRVAPGDAWDATDRELLDAIFDEECALRIADGRTGRPVRWQIEARRLRRSLHAFVDQDNTLRAAHGVVPHDIEMAFGVPGADQAALELPDLPALHGIADRVDLAPDGSAAVVYDYKTGSLTSYKKITGPDPTVGGTRLQLPVYALAAQARTGATDVRAAYWFINDAEHATTIGLDLTPDVMARFRESVGLITEGIDAGVFPAVPGPRTLNGFANCEFCEFDRICPTDRGRTWEAVQLDPRTDAFRALSETGAAAAPEGGAA